MSCFLSLFHQYILWAGWKLTDRKLDEDKKLNRKLDEHIFCLTRNVNGMCLHQQILLIWSNKDLHVNKTCQCKYIPFTFLVRQKVCSSNFLLFSFLCSFNFWLVICILLTKCSCGKWKFLEFSGKGNGTGPLIQIV